VAFTAFRFCIGILPSIHPARAAQTEEEPMSKNDQAQDDESQSDQVQNSDTQNAEDWQEGDQLRP